MTNLLLASAVNGSPIDTFQDDGTLEHLFVYRLNVSAENLALIFPAVAESALVDYARIVVIIEAMLHQVAAEAAKMPSQEVIEPKRVVDLNPLEQKMPSHRNWTENDYQMVELHKSVPQVEDPELARLEAGLSTLHAFYTAGLAHTPCLLKNLEYKEPRLDPAGVPIDPTAPNTVAPDPAVPTLSADFPGLAFTK